MSNPICTNCGQPCDVHQVDKPTWNTQGGQSCDVGCTGVSACCRAPYTIAENTGHPTCTECGSANIRRWEASRWDNDAQGWVLTTDDAYDYACKDCNFHEAYGEWVEDL